MQKKTKFYCKLCKKIGHVTLMCKARESEEASVYAEAALYFKELMEDCASINIARAPIFREIKNVSINKKLGRKIIWIEINQQNIQLDWLSEAGSHKSFMHESRGRDLPANYPETLKTTFTEKTKKYKYFNNQDIRNTGVLHISIKSRSWKANNCKILLVNHLPQNALRRDVLHKLGTSLTAS